MTFENKSTERLFKAIAGLSSERECADFFGDLCTIKEIQDMSQRFEAAVMLNDGAKYQDIAAAVKTSAATISQITAVRSL